MFGLRFKRNCWVPRPRSYFFLRFYLFIFLIATVILVWKNFFENQQNNQTATSDGVIESLIGALAYSCSTGKPFPNAATELRPYPITARCATGPENNLYPYFIQTGFATVWVLVWVCESTRSPTNTASASAATVLALLDAGELSPSSGLRTDPFLAGPRLSLPTKDLIHHPPLLTTSTRPAERVGFMAYVYSVPFNSVPAAMSRQLRWSGV